MSRFADLLGTVFTKFQLGIGGPILNNNAGTIEAKNAANSAYADISAALVNVFGPSVVLNAGATESGSSWKFTVQSPSTGQTEDLTLIWPGAAPSNGQALTVASFSAGVITLQWSASGGGANNLTLESTSIAFGSTSPVSMFTLPANAAITRIAVIVDTPFTGGTAPTLSIGVSGTTSKYVSSTQVDLTAAAGAGTVYEVEPGIIPDTASENLIATLAAGGSTAGAARINVTYGIPA